MVTAFDGTDPADPEGQYAVLRGVIEAAHGISLPQDAARHADVTRHAEAVIGAALGPEARAFLCLLADIVAADAWDTALKDVGVVHEGEPTPYRFGLVDLGTLDPTMPGLGYMHIMESKRRQSHFALLHDDAVAVRGGTMTFEYDARRGTLARAAAGGRNASLLGFALRMFGPGIPKGGAGFGLELSDRAAFLSEAARLFGEPADLGGEVALFGDQNVTLQVEPEGIIPVHLTIRDIAAPFPMTDALLEAAYMNRDVWERSLAKMRAATA